MDDAVYYKTVIPEPWTILGLRLRPFSLGHVLLLSRFESPFITDPSQAIAPDLLFAIFICSRSYEDGLAALDSPLIFDFIADWSRQLHKPRLMQRIGLEAPTVIDWKAKFKAFGQYVADGSLYPDYQVPATQTPGRAGLPLVHIVKVTLLTKTNLTETEILNRPWGLALTDYITLRAMEGAVEIVDRDEIKEALKQAEELYVKLNRGRMADASESDCKN